MEMAEPVSPTLEQLPKMSSGMQTEVAQRAGLKHVETQEKNVLPTKEDLEEERKREDFKRDIHDFDKGQQLKHVEAEEKSVKGKGKVMGKREGKTFAFVFAYYMVLNARMLLVNIHVYFIKKGLCCHRPATLRPRRHRSWPRNSTNPICGTWSRM